MYIQNHEFARQHLKDFKGTSLFTLSDTQLKLLEETKVIKPHEKAQLLQLITGTRMSTEIFLWSNYRHIKKFDLWVENRDRILEIEEMLLELPFRYFKGKFYRPHSKKDSIEEIVFFEVCANEMSYRYISNYWQTFSAHEHGVIYGYPTTTILAFLNMLERFPIKKYSEYSTAMKAIGPGFYSLKFFDEEKSHYEKVWDQLNALSKSIVKEAESYYEKLEIKH